MRAKTPQRVALYARVSTDHQSVANQLRELREVGDRLGWVICAEFTDRGVSGAKGRKDRPAFDKLCQGITRGEIDMVAAWSVDRLGRSLQDLVGFFEDLRARNCGLYLHQQAVDTTTPSGKAMFQMMGVFAEFERAMIRERVNAGLARAKAKGVTLGRPTVGDDVEARIVELRAQGLGMLKIAREAGCGTSVVQRVLRAQGAAATA